MPVLEFPKRHARTSAGSCRASGALAAQAVIIRAVIPAWTARSVAKIGAHHSAGILSRCHHFDTAEAPAPMSDAMPSREGQSSISVRNVVGAVMPNPLRQSVLNGKANVSADCGRLLGQTVLVDKGIASSQFQADFLGRTVAARKLRYASGREMAAALGWGEDQQPTYSKYESRTPLPHYLISQFCRITGVRVEWLVTGEGPGPAWQPVYPAAKPRRKGRRAARAA